METTTFIVSGITETGRRAFFVRRSVRFAQPDKCGRLETLSTARSIYRTRERAQAAIDAQTVKFAV